MDKELEIALDLSPSLLTKKQWELLYFSDEVDFFIIPSEKRSVKVWHDAVLKRIIPMDAVECKYDIKSLVNKYYELHQTLSGITDSYITEELAIDYFNKHHTVKHIPVRFITLEMAQISFAQDQDTTYIPNCLWDEEMAKADYQKYHDISRIPSKFITTPEMAKELYRKTGDIFALPFEFRTPELIMDAKTKNPDFFNLLPFSKRIETIKEEILTYESGQSFLEYIVAKYNIDSQAINDLMRYIRTQTFKQYAIIEQRMQEIEQTRRRETIIKAETLQSILSALNVTNDFKGFSRKQKVQCAYLLGKSDIESSINDIYDILYNDESLQTEYQDVMKFLKNILACNSNYKKPRRTFQNIDRVEYSHTTWLNEYNYEKEFYYQGNPNGYCITYSRENGVQVTIDAKKASEILDTLRENGVPTRECIVRQAYQEYGNDNLENFIISLEEGTFLEPAKTLTHK